MKGCILIRSAFGSWRVRVEVGGLIVHLKLKCKSGQENFSLTKNPPIIFSDKAAALDFPKFAEENFGCRKFKTDCRHGIQGLEGYESLIHR